MNRANENHVFKPNYRQSWVLVLSLLVILHTSLYAQIIQFQTTAGGIDIDKGQYVHPTYDGGYIMIGTTRSFPGSQQDNIWLVKFDQFGNIEWSRYNGDSFFEEGHCVQEYDENGNGRPDGYVYTGSYSSHSSGDRDFYIVKTDLKGVPLWSRTFGGSSEETGYFVQQTSDGGFIASGKTRSFGLPFTAGSSIIFGNMLILKVDANGDFEWASVISSSDTPPDISYEIRENSSGNFVLTGGIGGEHGAGDKDVVVCELASNGSLLWTRTYGGAGFDEGMSIREARDNFGLPDGYIVAGSTESFGAGKSDVYLLRLNTNGTVRWNRVFGGSDDDYGTSITQTSGGAFVAVGRTQSFGFGNYDVYAVKVDASGTLINAWAYGGIGNDQGFSIEETSDLGYAIGGFSFSFGRGSNDFYLIKTNSSGSSGCNETSNFTTSVNQGVVEASTNACWSILQLKCQGNFENSWPTETTANVLCLDRSCSAASVQFQHVYGESPFEPTVIEEAHSVEQTSDGAYILGGFYHDVSTNLDFYACKTDPAGFLVSGTVFQNRYWPGAGVNTSNDFAESIVETSDGGYLITGSTDYCQNQVYGWVVKTNMAGIPLMSAIMKTGSDDHLLWRGQECLDPGSGQPDGFICVGHTIQPPLKTYVVRLNANLSRRWEFFYSTATSDILGTYIQQTDDDNDGIMDDGFIVTGTGNTPFLLKIDNSGIPEWGGNLVNYSDGVSSIWCVQQTIGNGCIKDGYILVGQRTSDYYLLSTDRDGTPIWSKQLDFSQQTDVAHSVRQANDLGFVITGIGGPNMWSLKTGLDGSVEFSRRFGGLDDDGAYEVALTNDGGFAFGGFFDIAPNRDAYLVKTDCKLTATDPCYDFFAPPTEIVLSPTTTAVAVVATPVVSVTPVDVSFGAVIGDEEKCGTGLIDNGGSTGLAPELRANDSTESLTATSVEDIGQNLKPGNFDLYPNPLRRGSLLQVHYPHETRPQLILSVTDMLGKSIYQSTLEDATSGAAHAISTVGWSAGSYTVSITTPTGEQLGRMLIVVE